MAGTRRTCVFQVSVNKQAGTVTVSFNGDCDNVDRDFIKALFAVYVLSAPINMPKKKFSEFLSDMFGEAVKSSNRFDPLAVSPDKCPDVKRVVTYLRAVFNKDVEANIPVFEIKDSELPKGTASALIPPVDPCQVVVSYIYNKLAGDEEVFSRWAEYAWKKAVLASAQAGVELREG